MRRAAGAVELLDGDLDRVTLRGNLRDLARVNRWLGGMDLSWRALRPFLSADRDCSLLDIGTGGADIPIALLDRARQASLRLKTVATDIRPQIVALAREATREQDRLEVKLACGDRIEEPDSSFDIVHASLVIHHLEPAAAVVMLSEMARVARRAVILNDLDRGRQWHFLARVLSRLTTTNRYTRNDGPLSVLRAYRPIELRQLAAKAGLVEEARHWARPPYRYALVFGHKVRGDA